MSAPAAAADAPAPKGKKKLIIMIVAALLVLGGGGGDAAVFMMKKKAAEAAAAAAADEDEEGGGHKTSHAKAKPAAHDEHKAPPVFLPLDPFVVNLADKDADRFAQIGVTLEVTDAHAGDELKAYMPAIRNGILMVLAHKNSKELMERGGKEALAVEVMRETVRPLGIELPDDDDDAAPAKAESDDKPKKKKKKKKVEVESPVLHVYFSSFIIQ